MSLDNFEDEDLIVMGEEGQISFGFDSKEAKDIFLSTLESMAEKQERNKGEGYKCGNCAAYPCFRTMFSQSYFERDTSPFMIHLLKDNPKAVEYHEKRAREEAEKPAGLCFQHVRQCRQECRNYNQLKTESFWPKGICRIDKKEVNYEDECHISEIKKTLSFTTP